MWRLNRRGAAVFHTIGSPAGYFLIGLGIATCAAGIGLLKGQRWAWWFAVVLFAVEMTGDVATFFLTHDVLRTVAGVSISGMFLVLMLQSGVREWFREEH